MECPRDVKLHLSLAVASLAVINRALTYVIWVCSFYVRQGPTGAGLGENEPSSQLTAESGPAGGEQTESADDGSAEGGHITTLVQDSFGRLTGLLATITQHLKGLPSATAAEVVKAQLLTAQKEAE